jgi:hypothetical protein
MRISTTLLVTFLVASGLEARAQGCPPIPVPVVQYPRYDRVEIPRSLDFTERHFEVCGTETPAAQAASPVYAQQPPVAVWQAAAVREEEEPVAPARYTREEVPPAFDPSSGGCVAVPGGGSPAAVAPLGALALWIAAMGRRARRDARTGKS